MPTALSLVDIIHCSTSAPMVLWLIALTACAVCGLLIYSIASFREAPDDHPVSFVRHPAIEVMWAMIPILILVSTVTPSVNALVIAESNCRSASTAVE
jgi:heme/copper-type cytochrome/quinol oxidase subunit 2